MSQKLLKYINKEKLVTSEIATIGYVDSQVDSLRRELGEVKDAIGALIQKYDPPDTVEKRNLFSKGEYDPFAGNTERHLEIVRDDSKKLTPF